MPVLTDLAQAEVRRGVRKLYGEVLTRPALLVTDGLNNTYACDVNVGPTDPTGRINQLIDEKRGKTPLTGLPGQPPPDWTLGDELTINTVLRNCTIARGNQELIYADVGSPVECTRTISGQWEVTGFSRELPGTYFITPVDIPDLMIGPLTAVPAVPWPPAITMGETENWTISSRRLTLEELGTFAAFGVLPLGASAIFSGGELLRIV